MSTPPRITIPPDPQNFIIKGDLDVLSALNTADMGFGTVFIRNGGLYVDGLTDLSSTTITTTSPGGFNVEGDGEISFNVAAPITIASTGVANTVLLTSEGAIQLTGDGAVQLTSNASSIELASANAAFFRAASGTLTLDAASPTSGKVILSAAGPNPDSVLITATDALGQVTIDSSGSSTTDPAIILRASDPVAGNISILTLGADSEILLSSADTVTIEANGVPSGKVSITAVGDDKTGKSILLAASSTVGGSILLSASGTGDTFDPATNATSQSIQLLSNSATVESRISLLSKGTSSFNAIDITAPTGGINIDAGPTGNITINSDGNTNIDGGTAINIGTTSPASRVTIGGGSTATTIAGDLTVLGTTTTINTQTLNVADNVIVINSGPGEAVADSGMIIHRYQPQNGTAIGDVVNDVPNTPENIPKIIEQRGFVGATSTPTTVQLDTFASSVDDTYNGWWIKIIAGAAINEVRRVKSYVGATKVATIYDTADAGGTPPNPDGADWVTIPALDDEYYLYNASYVATFYDESSDKWTIATASTLPAAINDAGTSTVVIQQYQDLAVGAIDIVPKYYRNTEAVANTTDGAVIFTIINHGLAVKDKIRITNSSGLDPPIPDGTYEVLGPEPLDPDQFSIMNTAAANTVSDTASATINIMNSSVLRVNKIIPYDSGASGISIPGVSATKDVVIQKDSVLAVDITDITDISGSYLVLVSDVDPTGASAVFSASSSGVGGSPSRISSSRGADGQRIDAFWPSGGVIQIQHAPAAPLATPGSYTYRVRVISAI